MREVTALIKVQHPCVIPILGWFREGVNSFGIVMKFASNGALSAHLRRNGPSPLRNPTRQGILICDIIMGMRFIHEQGFMHRDLKPLKILLDHDWRGLISDFGLSREVSAPGAPSPNAGTDDYSAPEQLIWGFPYDNKVDVYAFGLVAYEIVTGSCAVNRRQSALPVESFGSLMQGLILRCWSEDPDLRPSFEAIFKEIERNGFAVLPKADPNVIRQSVSTVMDPKHP
jgi:serine/threonine protein kinase